MVDSQSIEISTLEIRSILEDAMIHHMKKEFEQEEKLLGDCDSSVKLMLALITDDVIKEYSQAVTYFYMNVIPYVLFRDSFDEHTKIELCWKFLTHSNIERDRDFVETLWNCLEDVELKETVKDLL